MQPHQQRVIDEKAELDVRIERLLAFLNGEVFKTLEAPEQEDMRLQADQMSAYSNTLSRRISRF